LQSHWRFASSRATRILRARGGTYMTNSLYFWVAVGWLWLATTLASAQALKDSTLMVTEVVAGLNAPTAMAFIGPDDILVPQKNDGQVRRVIGGVLQPTPVFRCGGEPAIRAWVAGNGPTSCVSVYRMGLSLLYREQYRRRQP